MSPAARLYRSACIPTVDIVFATTEKTCPAPIAVIHRRIKISSTPFHSLPKLKFELFSRIINYARVFLLLLKSGWFQEYNLFYVSTISISSLMLIARYEVSYKITYLHNTIQFPYRGELKEKEKKHLGFLNIGLKLLFPWPIHRVIFHHPTPSTPMLITRYQTTSCWKPFAPVSRDSRELSLARRSPTPSTIRRGDKVFQPWPNTCLLTAPFVILGEKARRYPNAINTRLKERAGIHGKRPGEFLLAQGKRLCSPRRATPNLPWNSISRYKSRRSRLNVKIYRVEGKFVSTRRKDSLVAHQLQSDATGLILFTWSPTCRLSNLDQIRPSKSLVTRLRPVSNRVKHESFTRDYSCSQLTITEFDYPPRIILPDPG